MKPRQTSPMLDAYLRRRFLAFLAILSFATCLIDFRSSAQGQVQVTTADPALAEQGTVNLNVKVTGKGFKNGAKAKWFVTGTTDTGGVTVNSTTFVSSTEVTANITVADTAVISNFDIQVLNSDGRGGKGTELFRVTAKGNGNASCPPLQEAPTSDTKCYAALPGCLDSTFGGVGFVHFNPSTGGSGTLSAVPNGLAVQGDGKIVVAIQAGFEATGTDIVVIRYNVDGSFDSSFGDADPLNPGWQRGYTITSLTPTSEWPLNLSIQPDGKIIVVGYRGSDSRYVVLRYESDGALDSTFGNGGMVTLSGSGARDIALQSDGKIVLGGFTTGDPNYFCVIRLNPNGSLDASFGSGGQVIANPSGSSKRGASSAGIGVAIQRVPAITGEERIVLTGSSNPPNTPPAWTIMRFRSNGATDTTLGTSGVVKTFFAGFRDIAHEVTIDSSNRIVVIGTTYTYNSNCGLYPADVADVALVRYSQDGALDASFGGGKKIVDVYGGRDEPVGLATQPDGKIVIFVDAGGYANGNGVNHTALIRFNADGTRDSTFGLSGNGIVTFDASGLNITHAGFYRPTFALSPVDGTIVAAGFAQFVPAMPNEMFVARYLP